MDLRSARRRFLSITSYARYLNQFSCIWADTRGSRIFHAALLFVVSMTRTLSFLSTADLRWSTACEAVRFEFTYQSDLWTFAQLPSDSMAVAMRS
ncbi:hypothetical protein D3C87_1908820 [compost metagenome]